MNRKFFTSLEFLSALFALIGSFVITFEGHSNSLVSGCWASNSMTFQVRDLANPNSPSPSETYSPTQHVSSCVTLEEQVFTFSKTYVRNMGSEPQKEIPGDLYSGVFCCIIIQAIEHPNDSLYTDVPFIDIGEGNKKYLIREIRCHR